MESALTHTLARFDWDFFVTLTFSGKRGEFESRRRCMLQAFLRVPVRSFAQDSGSLFWFCRLEEGELNGRLHYHVLWGGWSRSLVNVRTCMFLRDWWKKKTSAISVVRVFNRKLDGVSYVSGGANLYELGKFRDSVLYSHNLTATLSAWYQTTPASE